MSWSVPEIWKDGECFILGGGPSLTEQFNIPSELVSRVIKKEESPGIYSPYLKELHKKHCIGINASYLLGDWIDIVFFGDFGSFFSHHLSRLKEWPGLKVSCTPHTEDYLWIKTLTHDKKQLGISDDPSRVCWNLNSGAASISLAANMGVKRIILLGFDMKQTDNNTHWHSVYKRKPNRNFEATFRKHLKGFPFIAKDAHKRGIEILNASHDSMIDSFKKVSIKDIL